MDAEQITEFLLYQNRKFDVDFNEFGDSFISFIDNMGVSVKLRMRNFPRTCHLILSESTLLPVEEASELNQLLKDSTTWAATHHGEFSIIKVMDLLDEGFDNTGIDIVNLRFHRNGEVERVTE